MNRPGKQIVSLLLILTLALGLMPAQAADTAPTEMQSGDLSVEKPSIADIQQKYATVTTAETRFDEEPSAAAPYALGKLSQSFLNSGVTYLNYIRYLAGLPKVELTDEENTAAQYGAVLLAANDSMTHKPKQPEDMDDAFYEAGYNAANSSNLYARWASGETLNALSDALTSMMEDSSSSSNLSTLAHRRWLLNPSLLYTGFGYAEAAIRTGNADYRIYVDIPVLDRSGDTVDYNYIAWPASGYMPVQEFSTSSPWSVTLNPEIYASVNRDDISITITRVEDGKSYTFNSDTSSSTSTGGPFFCVNSEDYGEGETLIFRATTSYFGSISYGLGEYDVSVTGVKYLDGSDASFRYRVTFFDVETGSVGRDIPACSVGLSTDGEWWPSDGTVTFSYDGTEKKPYVRVYNGSTLLTQDTDYAVTYENNVNAGTGTVVLTGIGKYSGEKRVTFDIYQSRPTVYLTNPAATVDYNVYVGNTLQMKYSVTVPTDEEVSYVFTSKAPDIATVDENGVVTGISAGQTLIYITTIPTDNYAANSAACIVTVADKPTPNLYFSKGDITKTYGDGTFTAYAMSDGTSLSYTYTSSDESVATVASGGKVTIVGVGTTVITATSAETRTYASNSVSYTLTVNKAEQTVSASLSASTVAVGETAVVTASAPGGTLYYASSNPSVATVDDTGKVTGVAAGTATITVTADGDNHYEAAATTVTVTVTTAEILPDSVSISPTALSLTIGENGT